MGPRAAPAARARKWRHVCLQGALLSIVGTAIQNTTALSDKVERCGGPGGLNPLLRVYAITAASRWNMLVKSYQYFDFSCMHKWVIVYDGARIEKNPRLFANNSQVEEHIYSNLESALGNGQRNFALDLLWNRHRNNR